MARRSRQAGRNQIDPTEAAPPAGPRLIPSGQSAPCGMRRAVAMALELAFIASAPTLRALPPNEVLDVPGVPCVARAAQASIGCGVYALDAMR